MHSPETGIIPRDKIAWRQIKNRSDRGGAPRTGREGQTGRLAESAEEGDARCTTAQRVVSCGLVKLTQRVFNRSLEVKDGKTRYSRHRGREWRVSLPPFGETIELLKRGHKFEQRCHQGVFLGVKDNTTEKIMGNASDEISSHWLFCGPSPLPFGGSTVLETYSSTTSRSRPRTRGESIRG